MNARRSLIALLACTLATPAAAQRGRNFEDAVPRAKAMAERVDTAGALALLDSAVRARPRDASAWHLRGLILMETTRPAVRKGFFTDQATISRLRAADSSIKLATLYAPDSGRFELTLGRLLLFGNFIWLRAGAPEHFEKALVKARRVGDRPLMAELEDELGMVRWRAYESVANRHELFDTPSPDALLANNQLIAELLANHATEYDPPLGELDYRRAVDHFTQALTADPRNARAARHLFMALAERGGWEELRRAADVRTATVPDDPYAWLARGLAQFRLGDQRAAAAAFDGALARMSPAERARYSDVGRLMRPADSTTYAALDAAGRAEAERVYWAFVDPMTLTPENEHRLEFLSRVAHAELRWTSDDLYLKGADTDRGQVWVRYGPPDRIASFPAPTTRPEMPTTIWHYVLPGRKRYLDFVFTQPPTYGTATFGGNWRAVAEDARYVHGARWENVPITREMDTAVVQIARFRGTGDSSDVIVVAGLPATRMGRTLDLTRGTIDVAFQVTDSAARPVMRSTSREVMPLTREDTTHRRVWQFRAGPATLAYRVEALQREAMRGAIAVGPLPIERRTGFGMSDVLVADRAVPRDSTYVHRWTDLLLAPTPATFRSGQPFDIVWETYALGDANGQNRYRIDISVAVIEYIRVLGEDSSFSARTKLLALRVRDKGAALVRRVTGSEQVALSFTRERPARPVALDYFTMELGDARAGRYRLRVTTTDLQTNRATSSDREIRIVN